MPPSILLYPFVFYCFFPGARGRRRKRNSSAEPVEQNNVQNEGETVMMMRRKRHTQTHSFCKIQPFFVVLFVVLYGHRISVHVFAIYSLVMGFIKKFVLRKKYFCWAMRRRGIPFFSVRSVDFCFFRFFVVEFLGD